MHTTPFGILIFDRFILILIILKHIHKLHIPVNINQVFSFVFSRSFDECWESLCLLKSTFRWKRFSQIPHANGLYPLCFLMCVIKLEDWLNTFPHTTHLWGFSPIRKIKCKMRWMNKASELEFYSIIVSELIILKVYLPVCMYVCFFMSDFWWNLFPQYWQGYGLVSECINRWVDKVELRLKHFPHCSH